MLGTQPTATSRSVKAVAIGPAEFDAESLGNRKSASDNSRGPSGPAIPENNLDSILNQQSGRPQGTLDLAHGLVVGRYDEHARESRAKILPNVFHDVGRPGLNFDRDCLPAPLGEHVNLPLQALRFQLYAIAFLRESASGEALPKFMRDRFSRSASRVVGEKFIRFGCELENKFATLADGDEARIQPTVDHELLLNRVAPTNAKAKAFVSELNSIVAVRCNVLKERESVIFKNTIRRLNLLNPLKFTLPEA